jgi:hypothetical protein
MALTAQLQSYLLQSGGQYPMNGHSQQQQQRVRLCRESLKAYRCAFTMKNYGRIRLDTTILLALTNNMCHLLTFLGMHHQCDQLRELLATGLVTAIAGGEDPSTIFGMDGFWKTALTKSSGGLRLGPSIALAA